MLPENLTTLFDHILLWSVHDDTRLYHRYPCRITLYANVKKNLRQEQKMLSFQNE